METQTWRETAGRAWPTPVVVAGHVDHGKSTLIGRLLYETGQIAEGRLEALREASARRGLAMEWSFLLDALQAERDQGVTIESTRLPLNLGGREFVIIDAPGHRQFMRNALTGAAAATAALLVVDAQEGVREQTRRHALLLRLIGVRDVVVVLNKADLLDYAERPLRAAEEEVRALLGKLGLEARAVIPASAREGENVRERGERLSWYAGPSVVEALMGLAPPRPRLEGVFRLPVQDVYRRGERRFLAGRVESGRVRVGDTVLVGARGHRARVKTIAVWPEGEWKEAVAGQSVALELTPELVVARGDLLYPEEAPPERANRLRVRLLWLRDEPLRLGETLLLRLGPAQYPVRVETIHAVIRTEDLREEKSEEVPPEDIAEVTLLAADEILFDPFSPEGGGRGVLVDTRERIVAAAPILGRDHARAAIFPLKDAISHADRARLKGYGGAVFWLTGLPAAGKSTLAREAERRLFAERIDAVVLDGDTLRDGLNADLGFTPREREENVRRTAEVAKLMAQSGLVVLVALISPRLAMRAMARRIIGDLYAEIYVAADPATCEARDPKGLYARARAGEIREFTGIDGSYEAPTRPDLVIDTSRLSVDEASATLVDFIKGRIFAPVRP
jgi:bifunctional enzyme CysN/CysC